MRAVRSLGKLWASDSPSLLLIGRLATAAIGLITAPLVARLVGPDGRGVTAAAIAVYTVVPVLLGMGVPIQLRRLVAVSGSLAPVRAARRYVLLSFVPATGFAVVSGLLVFAELDRADLLAASIGVLATPLTLSWTCDVSALVAQSRFRGIFLILVSQPISYLVALGAVWLSGIASVPAVIGASIASTALTAVLARVIVRPKRDTEGEKTSMGSLVRQSTKFAGAAIAESAMNRADQIVMLPVIGAYQAGIYSVAATIALLPLPVGQAVGSAYFRAIARSNEASSTHLLRRALKTAAILSFAAIIALAALTPLAIPALFGEDFVGSIPVTWIALVGSGFLVVGYVASNALAALNRGLSLSTVQVSSALIGIALLMVLGPAWGAVGAAVSSSVTYAAATVTMILLLRPGAALLQLRVSDLRNAIDDLLRRRPE